jgi:hypothetical protein
LDWGALWGFRLDPATQHVSIEHYFDGAHGFPSGYIHKTVVETEDVLGVSWSKGCLFVQFQLASSNGI